MNNLLNIVNSDENQLAQKEFKKVLLKIFPDTSKFYKPIHCIHSHYKLSVDTANACYTYIVDVYPKYIKKLENDIINYQNKLIENWKILELSGFTKIKVILTIYEDELINKRIIFIENLLWWLQRSYQPKSTIKKAVDFMEFYERRYPHFPRRDYTLFMSEYF